MTHEFFELLTMANDGQLIRPTTQKQNMKSKLVQIFFFNGDAMETTEVLHADLPRLAGARTFWRESIPDALRGVLLKKKIALEFKKCSKTAQNQAKRAFGRPREPATRVLF